MLTVYNYHLLNSFVNLQSIQQFRLFYITWYCTTNDGTNWTIALVWVQYDIHTGLFVGSHNSASESNKATGIYNF